MTSIALVRLLGSDRLDANTADQNVGLSILTDVAESIGAKCDLFDPLDLDAAQPPDWSRYAVVGFSVHYLNAEITFGLIRQIKRGGPNVKIVLGGHQVGPCAQEVINDMPDVDAVFVGEAELAFEAYLRRVLSGQNESRRVWYPPRLLQPREISWPKRKSVTKIARIHTSRGCPYRCSFCTTPALVKLHAESDFRARSPSSVIEEILSLHERGATHLYVNDDVFFTSRRDSIERATQIARALIDAKSPVTYKIQIRCDSALEAGEGVLRLLRESGLRDVFLGIEAGSNATLREYRKNATSDAALLAVPMLQRLGIKVNAGNIAASPESTLADVHQSIAFFGCLGLAYLFFRRVTFRVLVFPGTELEGRLERSGRLSAGPRYFPRSYSFSDESLGRVVELFEREMPRLIRDVGARAFQARNLAVSTAMLVGGGLAESVDHVLRTWSAISADFLGRWFNEKPPANASQALFASEIDQYMREVERVTANLESLSDNAVDREVTGDTF